MTPDEPRLTLLSDTAMLERPRAFGGAVGSAAVHALIGVLVAVIPWGPAIVPGVRRQIERVNLTPLVVPPRELTQRAPNQAKPSTEVNLSGLLSRPEPTPPPVERAQATQPAAPRRVFQAPPAPAPVAPKPEVEAPKLETRGPDLAQIQTNTPPGLGQPQVTPPPAPPPPPRIEAEERPKLAFEKPGGLTPSRSTGVAPGRLAVPPKSTVDEAMRAVARGGGGGLVVGDLGEGVGGLGAALNNPNAPVKNSSALELMSDPMGADFKPYLIRILSTVRRNWTAVIPESARLGSRRGRVLIQFAINRDGSVPKLVIATGSGSDALDRAAVAGISASNPFPPLPDEFKGGQVRLQFTFLYNMPK